MLRDYLIEHCQKTYDNSCAGNCGINCNNRSSCKGSCDTAGGCLDQVHWYPKNGGRSDYNCEHLLQKYVLCFTDRYKAQIVDALRVINDSCYPYYCVLSIGCGGTPDLMAFEEWTNKPIVYDGYDRNETWETLHGTIKGYTDIDPQITADLTQKDIFDVISRQDFPLHQYNVVVIQYLLSHLYNTKQEERIMELFDGLINKVLPKRCSNSPFLIIICDIDSRYKGRSKWFSLLDKLEQAQYHGNAFARSHYPTGDLGEERWSTCKLSPFFGNIAYHYCQNETEHDAAQLIIELE